MNLKNLGNATLIVAILFGAAFLCLVIGHFCPVALCAIVGITLVAVIYHAMQNDEEDQQ